MLVMNGTFLMKKLDIVFLKFLKIYEWQKKS